MVVYGAKGFPRARMGKDMDAGRAFGDDVAMRKGGLNMGCGILG